MTEKWEYKLYAGGKIQMVIINGDQQFEKDLNQFGLEGWEAISYFYEKAGKWVLFKRRLP